LVKYIGEKRGVTFVTMSEVAAAFRKEVPLVPGGIPLRHREARQ
jgi:hypothetical protein